MNQGQSKLVNQTCWGKIVQGLLAYYMDRVAQLRLCCLLAVLSLTLSGCISYDLGLHFDSPSQGMITQRIQIGERLQNLGDATVRQWLQGIEQQAKAVGGEVVRLPNKDLQVTIPFRDAVDLEHKFNQFFALRSKAAIAFSNLPSIPSRLVIKRSNLLFFERTHLSYDVDLRRLGVIDAGGDLLLSSGGLIDLGFHLETPWQARVIAPQRSPAVQQVGRQITWQLLPGTENHLEAVFWMPNPIGIGALVIALMVAIGQYLRYPPLPQSQPPINIPLSPTNTR